MRISKYVLALPLLASCAGLARLGGVAGGAALGSLAGPGGAAVGAAGGLYVADASLPASPPAPPETIWGLLAMVIDQAAWLAFVIALLWALAWVAPSPKELFRRLSARIKGGA